MKDLLISYLIENSIDLGSMTIEDIEDTELCDLEEQFELTYDEIDECYIPNDEAISLFDGSITNSSNSHYCEFSENHFSDRDYSLVRVYGFRRKTWLSSYYLDSGQLSEFNIVQISCGDLYNIESTNFVESEGEYYLSDETYYWESDGEYHLDSEPENDEFDEEDRIPTPYFNHCHDRNFSYHGSSPWNLSDSNKSKVGFEVEKEDSTVKNSFTAYDLQCGTGWGKENDGSLDSDSGFELVSPIFTLHASDEYFASEFEKVRVLLDADYSSHCGGHINYSNPNYYNNYDLLDEIKGYLPLIYALYPKRINGTYCQAKSLQRLKDDREKYQAINIKANCLEFRIFPAVKSAKQLLWRLGLIQIIDLYKTRNVLEVIENLTDFSHPLHLHFIKIYSFEKLNTLVSRTAKFASTFENYVVSERKLSEIETKLLLTKLNN